MTGFQCALCGKPASACHMFAHATQGVAAPGPKCAQTWLCDEHAKEWEAEQARWMVDQIRKTLALRERLAEMPARITLEYLADDDQSADALRRKLRERSEPTVRPLPVGDLRFHLSAALPVPPDVARNGWYDWIARTTTVPGCRLIGWGCDFEEP